MKNYQKQRSIQMGLTEIFLVVLLTAGTACSQTLALKANIGVCACWDALSLNIYELFGVKVGTFGMLMNILCVLVQLAIQGRGFQRRSFLMIPYAVLYGVFVNLFNYDLIRYEPESYAGKLLFVVAAYVGIGLCMGMLLLLNLIAMPSETVCNVISGKYHLDYAKVRISLDAGIIAVSVAISLVCGLSLKVREGTIIGMVLLGSMEKISMRIFEPLIARIQSRGGHMQTPCK